MPASNKPDSFPPLDRPEDVDKVIKYFKEFFGREITPGERSYLNELRKKLELIQPAPEYRPKLTHPEIRWNEHVQEWHCVKCGRRSDHIREADAWQEINAFACIPATPLEGEACEHL